MVTPFIETDRLFLIPVDCEILDSLLESDKAFENRLDLSSNMSNWLANEIKKEAHPWH